MAATPSEDQELTTFCAGLVEDLIESVCMIGESAQQFEEAKRDAE